MAMSLPALRRQEWSGFLPLTLLTVYSAARTAEAAPPAIATIDTVAVSSGGDGIRLWRTSALQGDRGDGAKAGERVTTWKGSMTLLN